MKYSYTSTMCQYNKCLLSFLLSRNFTFLYNFVYGNCYVFSEKNNTKYITEPGSENGEFYILVVSVFVLVMLQILLLQTYVFETVSDTASGTGIDYCCILLNLNCFSSF